MSVSTDHPETNQEGKIVPYTSRPQGTRGATWACLLLAGGATLLSLAFAVLLGWQRGGTQLEKAVHTGLGLLAVLGAHLLLPLGRALSDRVHDRLWGALLWVALVVYTATRYADYFIDVKAQQAERRVTAMESATLSTITVPKRSLSAILEEEAAVRVKWMQARRTELSCDTGCETLKSRLVALKDRVTVLEAEEDEVRRWQVAQDEWQRRTQGLRNDPVTSRLERDFGVTPAVSSAVTVLPAVVILEGLGAYCWCLLLHGRVRRVTRGTTQAVTAPVTGPATARLTGAADGHGDASPMADAVMPAVMTSVTSQAAESETAEIHHNDSAEPPEVHALAAKVWGPIKDGRVKPTVRAIRAHLGIAQEQARAVAQVIRDWQAAGTGRIGPGHNAAL